MMKETILINRNLDLLFNKVCKDLQLPINRVEVMSDAIRYEITVSRAADLFILGLNLGLEKGEEVRDSFKGNRGDENNKNNT